MHSPVWVIHSSHIHDVLLDYDGSVDWESTDHSFVIPSEALGLMCIKESVKMLQNNREYLMRYVMGNNMEEILSWLNITNTDLGYFREKDLEYHPFLYDWYAIGGRWYDTLPLKEGTIAGRYDGLKQEGVGKYDDKGKRWCSSAKISDVDWGLITQLPSILFYEGDDPKDISSLSKLEYVVEKIKNSGMDYVTIVDCHS